MAHPKAPEDDLDVFRTDLSKVPGGNEMPSRHPALPFGVPKWLKNRAEERNRCAMQTRTNFRSDISIPNLLLVTKTRLAARFPYHGATVVILAIKRFAAGSHI